MDRVVGIGEYIITSNRYETVKTYALASCVALILYCPNNKIAGMAHIALPTTLEEKEKGNSNPAYFADKAVPLLIDNMVLGYGCKTSAMKAGLFGGADSAYKNDYFNIGRRNLEIIKSKLVEYGITCGMSDTGGFYSRTVEIEVATGKVSIHKQSINI